MIGAPKSVRARLTLWYLGALALVLFAYAALVYILMRGQLGAELDRHLHRDYEIATQALYARPDGEVGWREPQHFHAGARLDTEAMIVERLATLVDGLLLLARADEGRLSPARAPVALDELVADTVALMQPLAEEKRQQIAVRVESGVRAFGDRALLQQVLMNLLDNAVRHCPGDAHITVSTAGVAGSAVLEVADDGPGIPMADRERVFDCFFRVDAARTRDERSGGFGLGLAIVRALVAAQGGRIALADTERGTRFSIALQRA